MTHDFPPRAHFHLQNCASSRCVPAGSISVTKNFDARGRPFGSKHRDAALAGHSERSRLPRRSLVRRLGGISGNRSMINSHSAMRIITTVAEAQSLEVSKRRVLVPTMGALHKAHAELIRVARENAGQQGEVAVSIFVNPLQFEPGSDYERYPRRQEADEEFCRDNDVDFLFRPSAAEMYADDRSVFVNEFSLSETLEGKSRTGHFRGVCTVVAKLFNILSSDAAVFGEKDFQQLAIVRRMVRDLNFKINIIAVPTVREHDGLAYSSRNQYLNAEERKQATVLYKASLAALAVYFGKTRLIDNIRLE